MSSGLTRGRRPRRGPGCPMECSSSNRSIRPSSTTGCIVASDKPIPPPPSNLPNLSHPFSMLARVVWNHRDETKPDAPSGMGVQFLDPKPPEGALIDVLVDRLCSEMSLALDSSPSTAPSHYAVPDPLF